MREKKLLETLKSHKQQTKWIDWVKDYGEKIENLRNKDLDVVEKKKFLGGVLKEEMSLLKINIQ